jgi:hypothetical protein
MEACLFTYRLIGICLEHSVMTKCILRGLAFDHKDGYKKRDEGMRVVVSLPKGSLWG